MNRWVLREDKQCERERESKTGETSDATAARFVVGQSGESENTQNGKRERWASIASSEDAIACF